MQLWQPNNTVQWHWFFLYINNTHTDTHTYIKARLRVRFHTFPKTIRFKASSLSIHNSSPCFSRTLLYKTLLFVSLLVNTENLFPWQPPLPSLSDGGAAEARPAPRTHPLHLAAARGGETLPRPCPMVHENVLWLFRIRHVIMIHLCFYRNL